MTEKLINEFMASIYEVVPTDQIQPIIDRLRLTLNNYDVSQKETAIIRQEDIFPQCYKIFMVSKKIEGMSDNTLKLYKLYIEDMLTTINLPIEKITSNSVKVYLYNLQQSRGITNRTLDCWRRILNSFFSWAVLEGYIDKNPIGTIKTIKYAKKEREPLTDTELELLRQACDTLRDKAMVEFFYSTGCRVTELVTLNRDDVNFDTGEVTLLGKGNKYRKSYLSAKAKLCLTQYLESRDDCSDALFVSEYNPHTRINKNGVERRIKKLGGKAGIDRLHPHLLRHTMATNCLQHGMDVTQVQQLLGHCNLNTTMIYAKVDSSDVQSLHRKCIC